MTRTCWPKSVRVVLALAVWLAAAAALTAVEDPAMSLTQADRLQNEGNFREAWEAYRVGLVDPAADPAAVADALPRAVDCLRRINAIHEVDKLLEEIAAAHATRWQVLAAVARQYRSLESHGILLRGEFRRGPFRGGGESAHVTARDRVRSLQLFDQARRLAEQDAAAQGAPLAGLFAAMADALVTPGDAAGAWRLQLLTDLATLPEPETGWPGYGAAPSGAPVTADGEPVYYELPAAWDGCRNDGERWRWLLHARETVLPADKFQVLCQRAEFLHSQFGVQTLADFAPFWQRLEANGGGDGDRAAREARFSLTGLSDDETIARLASGIKRFTLPKEQNPVRLWRQVLEEAPRTDAAWQRAAAALADVRENRRQFDQAAELWQQLASLGADQAAIYRPRAAQILGNWGEWEPSAPLAAGRPGKLEYRFRNGTHVDFVARPIAIGKLIADVKQYLQSRPAQLDGHQFNLENLGYRLVVEGEEKYLLPEAERWSLDLEPREGHLDRRTSVAIPLKKPGAYLVTARMKDGNASHLVVWVAGGALVKKPLKGETLYYLADATTGEPLPQRHVEFFGFRHEGGGGPQNVPPRVETTSFAQFTDAQGMVRVRADDARRRYTWLAVARVDAAGQPPAQLAEGSFAWLGFHGVWGSDYYDQQYEQLKVYAITDRPVYRPGQQVDYKFWIANAKYDQPDASPFAGQSFVVEIRDPQGEKVESRTLVADAFGGIAGQWTLPADAALGPYSAIVVNHGGGMFRVEEYKKPEFEVRIDAPAEPTTLGETIQATIRADYYFGSPVAGAKVSYKILRTPQSDVWFPPGPWDWLYGPGYWWIGGEASWHPSWRRWGCGGPWPWWRWRPSPPPEVVAQNEGTLGPDGTLEISIDTSVARELHPDDDHRYQIVAEVTDPSRRTVAAEGSVLAARSPAVARLWTDRGFYAADDPVTVHLAVATADGKPLAAAGKLRMLRLAFDGEEVVETEVADWNLNADAQGDGTLQIKAATPGQYRLVCEAVVAAAGEGKPLTVSAGALLTIRGEGAPDASFRFSDLEITPDRATYQPGDTARLQIASSHADAAVLLFVRPSNGVYLPPQLVRLTGRETIVDVPLEASDVPNVFVEAVTIAEGHVRTAVRELLVPPTERVARVEVTPSQQQYLPGEKASLDLKVTDEAGRPLAGSLVLAVYDKALDAIAGGDFTPDIREFFWKWRRSHQPASESSLDRTEHPLGDKDSPTMQPIGMWGSEIADELAADRSELQEAGGFGGGDMKLRFFARGRMSQLHAAAPPMAAMAMESDAAGAAKQAPGSDAAAAAPTVRRQFADTALWVAALTADADGVAHAELTMPENLTAWNVKSWVMSRGTRVGEAAATVVTRKRVMVRLQAPRYFVERDEVVLSANVHNELPEAATFDVSLEIDGPSLAPQSPLHETVMIGPGEQRRVDWPVKVVAPGSATIRALAVAPAESDAMEMTFPVAVHGMLRTETFGGAIAQDDSEPGVVEFEIPADVLAAQTRLELRFSPSLAAAALDALPYLADYPYGCTEQTLNRFLPAVLARNALEKQGLDLAALLAAAGRLDSQATNPPRGGGRDGAIDDKNGRKPGERSPAWKRSGTALVADEATLNAMVRSGLTRLADLQVADGGWGWFGGWGARSDAHSTATVVRGLVAARTGGVALPAGMAERGAAWLASYQVDQLAALDNWDHDADKPRHPDRPAKRIADNIDALVAMTLAEAVRAGVVASPVETAALDPMLDRLFRDRTELTPYGLALAAAAVHARSSTPTPPPESGQRLAALMRNLSQYLQTDDENQTAWLDLPVSYWAFWFGSEIETQATYVKLLSAVEPQSTVTPRLSKYLLNNRKHATYWHSTRDTALVVEALVDYLQASGESAPQMTVEVLLDGQVRKTVEITPATLLTFDNSWLIEGEELPPGKHRLEVRRIGGGPLYFNASLTTFPRQEPILAAGLEVKIVRRLFKLEPIDAEVDVADGGGRPVSQAVEKYRRIPIDDGAVLTSGDLVEVELTLDSKNDYEHLLVESPKPAGCEPVELRSGYSADGLGAYVEYRDDRAALFLRTLARGTHSFSYRLRAEIPGRFAALPATVAGMYAPELVGNSAEDRVRIEDAP